MDDSKFNLWRACFSFCFVDGFLAPQEQKWIESKLASLAFSEAQKQILINDLKSAPDIEKLLPLIKSQADRGFLINQIRFLSKLDSELSSNEKAKIDEMQKSVMSRINMESLNDIIAADEKASYHEDEVYKVDNKHSYIERMVKRLMKLANLGDYKFPKQ